VSEFLQICQRLSLREPLQASLKILVELIESGDLPLGKTIDLDAALRAIKARIPKFTNFDREFPSLCFALATGVGKTRLMAAIIAWLFCTGRSRNFLVLAPNLTIYDKLKRDFDPASPKYLFKGLDVFRKALPEVVTGDDWDSGRGARYDLFASGAPIINIFNIGKLNSRGKDQTRMRNVHEAIGASYFDYLSTLPDLVMLMDEAHRYRADAGARSIDELRPILGIELTATPKTTGAKAKEFNNIAYRYTLGQAIHQGFVKEPRVATRKDFNPRGVPPEALERIKLEDGVHVHEHTNMRLLQYAQARGLPVVHPFMLVVASDTTHANAIRLRMEHDDFFGGRYRGRVMEIHSKTSAAESDENTTKLLRIEQDRNIDVVIHVDKLKEGWDVTNLYTIVPLRASAAEILTEQTIGRGLRLPYGQRTGDSAVDMLTIVAHDRFREILDAANMPDSLIHASVEVGDDAEIDPRAMKPILALPTHLSTLNLSAQQSQNPADNNGAGADLTLSPSFIAHADPAEHQLLVNAVLDEIERESRYVKHAAEARITQIAGRVAMSVPIVMPSPEQVRERVADILASVINYSIEIPEISLRPSRPRNYRFVEFELKELDRIRLQPVSEDILVQSLLNGGRELLTPLGTPKQYDRPEIYLIDQLIQRDEIDYDPHADLLENLASQVIAELRRYLTDDNNVRNVAMHHRRTLADLIWYQMREHKVEDEVEYIPSINKAFTVLRAQTLNSGDGQLHAFDQDPPVGMGIRRLVFTGFQKCCFSAQKFDSFEGEFQLARLLERDPEVVKWLKPAHGQFRILYDGGKHYHPDFVVETQTERFIVELKREDWKEEESVRRKAQAAALWCQHASAIVKEKPFSYLLIPHMGFGPQFAFATLRKQYLRTSREA
jgi:type III restriction enzyme